MKKLTLTLLIPLLFIVSILFLYQNFTSPEANGAPPYAIGDLSPPEDNSYSWLYNWQRPDGPAKVGLQVGHLNSSEFPDELERLRGNSGASGGGKKEVEVNSKIAELTAETLRQKGITVEILPATIPPDFWADVFVAIHADGSTDFSKNGFKIARPRRDYTGKAQKLLYRIESEFRASTGLETDPNVTRNMTGYYAFAWWRYEHSIHPMTPAIILETGFLSSPHDREIIVDSPERSAKGLSQGIIYYLEDEGLISANNQ